MTSSTAQEGSIMVRHLSVFSGLALGVLLIAGCQDSQTGIRHDHTPPSAPHNVYSVTGDTRIWLNWDPNPESDVAFYRVYEAACDGPSCLYSLVGSTYGLQYEVAGLVNGVTRYFAVAAVDRAGNESDLSYNSVFDTPRPEGFGLPIRSVENDPDHSGYDFSRYSVLPYDDSEVDIIYTVGGAAREVQAPFVDTDIQDMGPTTTLDDIDWAPSSGWSPSGAVEVIPGHAYVVWTYDNHFAKFRVVSATSARIVVDWAYQVDIGNHELKAQPARDEDGQPAPRVRRASALASR
jgi:hypothetical protein